jgi:hypothetical protein
MNEMNIKKRVKLPVKCMVEKPVPHACLVNISWLWIRNIESIISPMDIGFVFEVSMESEYVVGKPVLEFLYIFLAPLPFKEFFPCLEQIF